jgi:hypothetical protein
MLSELAKSGLFSDDEFRQVVRQALEEIEKYAISWLYSPLGILS